MRPQLCVFFLLALCTFSSVVDGTSESCYSDYKTFNRSCQAVDEQSRCRKQTACHWGIPGKCTGKDADFVNACANFTHSDCEKQLACEWSSANTYFISQSEVVACFVTFVILMGLSMITDRWRYLGDEQRFGVFLAICGASAGVSFLASAASHASGSQWVFPGNVAIEEFTLSKTQVVAFLATFGILMGVAMITVRWRYLESWQRFGVFMVVCGKSVAVAFLASPASHISGSQRFFLGSIAICAICLCVCLSLLSSSMDARECDQEREKYFML